jgi:hypothetical protein
MGLEPPEAGLPVEHTILQKVFDQVGAGAVERDHDDLRRSFRSLIVTVVGPGRWPDGSDGEEDRGDGEGKGTRAQMHGLSSSARRKARPPCQGFTTVSGSGREVLMAPTRRGGEARGKEPGASADALGRAPTLV